MNLRKYHNKEVITVTSLPSSYRGYGSQETLVYFFEWFKKDDGQNDVKKVI